MFKFLSTIVVLLLGLDVAAAACGFSPTNLRVNNLVNPLGVPLDRPTSFGWGFVASTPAAEGLVQSAFQLDVSDAVTKTKAWISGKVASAQTLQVAYGGLALKPSTLYRWHLTVYDGSGTAVRCRCCCCFCWRCWCWVLLLMVMLVLVLLLVRKVLLLLLPLAAAADFAPQCGSAADGTFETALAPGEAGWEGAAWLARYAPKPLSSDPANCELYQQTARNSAPRFRSKVTAPPGVASARVYVAGLGYYQLYDDYLAIPPAAGCAFLKHIPAPDPVIQVRERSAHRHVASRPWLDHVLQDGAVRGARRHRRARVRRWHGRRVRYGIFYGSRCSQRINPAEHSVLR